MLRAYWHQALSVKSSYRAMRPRVIYCFFQRRAGRYLFLQRYRLAWRWLECMTSGRLQEDKTRYPLRKSRPCRCIHRRAQQ